MEIRPAKPEDVPQVLPLVQKICDLHEHWDPERLKMKPNVAELYRNWMTQRATDPRSVFLVADHDGKIVAYVICTIEAEIPIYWTRECGFIHDLWVEEDYRNEGVARQLTMLTIERFKELGVKQIRLQTAVNNEIGRKLFESCGFRNSSIEMLCPL